MSITSRLRLLLIPPASSFVLGAIILKVQVYVWLRSATPEEMSDDAAQALLGWWPTIAAALFLLVLQAVVVLPIVHRARRGAAVIGIALAIAVTVPLTVLFRAPEVEGWYVTFAVVCLVVGVPVLLQAVVTNLLLRASRPSGMARAESGQRESS
jgi:hypothetical protein